MHTVPVTGPVDDLGRLVHEGDAAAQLALSVTRLEAALADQGHALKDLAALRVLTIDRATVKRVLDVLDERLDLVGATPPTTVHDVSRLPLAGMVVALEADVVCTTHSARDSTMSTHHRRKRK